MIEKTGKAGFTTTILHSDRNKSIEHGALHKPVHHSVAFGYPDARDLAAVFQGKEKGFAYGRQGNPTIAALEDKVTQMETGIESVCFSTGMAAIAATMTTLLRAGDHLVSSSYLFGNTDSFFKTLISLSIEVSFVDATEVENIRAAYKPNTRAVFVETIANPCTQVSDLAGIGDFCEQNGLIYIVDNTLTTPYLFLPVKVKASLVINSLTKYIGGHGNALGGAVTDCGLFDWTRCENIHQIYKTADPASWALRQIRKKGLRDAGAALSPESAHLLAVGSETLALRMTRSCANALALANFFDSHPDINQVFYPGLIRHPQHWRAKNLFRAYSSILSVEVKPGINYFDFLNALNVAVISSNLGDNRTLAIPVAHTIYHEMGARRRADMGIADGLVRLSVGIEDQPDLIDDFTRALAQAHPG